MYQQLYNLGLSGFPVDLHLLQQLHGTYHCYLSVEAHCPSLDVNKQSNIHRPVNYSRLTQSEFELLIIIQGQFTFPDIP